ncbi:MAG: non-canonical purine NTP pyrophosphatase [Candidatus Aenigmarchaeota archaeon]|nr:non-canonical purine NTP pyrophosphatase [Candidatus Aenigmarchaeota archaeon]
MNHNSIIVVTGNKDKFDEIAKTLAEFKIAAKQVNMSIEEKGSTLEEIVVDKAKKAFEQVKQPLIVDDTGVYFNAYDDFPGPFPKRVFEKFGLAGLLKKLEGKDRGAAFKTVICYIDEKGYKLFYGALEGTITEKIHDAGERASLQYERIFIPFGYKITVSAMSIEDKIKISHRAHATRKFVAWFKKL